MSIDNVSDFLKRNCPPELIAQIEASPFGIEALNILLSQQIEISPEILRIVRDEIQTPAQMQGLKDLSQTVAMQDPPISHLGNPQKAALKALWARESLLRSLHYMNTKNPLGLEALEFILQNFPHADSRVGQMNSYLNDLLGIDQPSQLQALKFLVQNRPDVILHHQFPEFFLSTTSEARLAFLRTVAISGQPLETYLQTIAQPLRCADLLSF